MCTHARYSARRRPTASTQNYNSPEQTQQRKAWGFSEVCVNEGTMLWMRTACCCSVSVCDRANPGIFICNQQRDDVTSWTGMRVYATESQQNQHKRALTIRYIHKPHCSTTVSVTALFHQLTKKENAHLPAIWTCLHRDVTYWGAAVRQGRHADRHAHLVRRGEGGRGWASLLCFLSLEEVAPDPLDTTGRDDMQAHALLSIGRLNMIP